MANTFHVSMVSADRQLYSGKAERLVATAERGELGILAGHAPFLSILKAGQVRLTLPDGKEEVIYISGGFIEVQQGQTIILADDADTLVLGCTHYPLLKPLLRSEAPHLTLVDSAATTAASTAQALAAADLLRHDDGQPTRYRYCVSDIPLRFNSIGERFLGRSLGDIETVPLG